MHKAIYPGSFDPFTRGHLDIACRAYDLFNNLTIVVGVNPTKSGTFSHAERVKLTEETIKRYANGRHIRVDSYTGLMSDYAILHGVKYIVKGVRNFSDFDYERLIHEITATQNAGLELIPISASKKYEHVSSSAVRELAKYKGLISDYVTPNIKEFVEQRILDQTVFGVTGVIGSGKSHYCHRKVEQDPSLSYINLDEIAHEIREGQNDLGMSVRNSLIDAFGTHDRKELGEIVFRSQKNIDRLNDIFREPMMLGVRQKLIGIRASFCWKVPCWPSLGGCIFATTVSSSSNHPTMKPILEGYVVVV